MDALAHLAAQRDCERLTYRYCRFADFGHASRLAELFTEDGVFATPEMTLRGRLEIARTFAERESLTDLQTLHLCTNIDVEPVREDAAWGWVYLCLFRRWKPAASSGPVPVTMPSLVAAYEDSYVRRGGEWLIARRSQRVLFADPGDLGWVRPGH